MLGLSTHEPLCYILRDVPLFTLPDVDKEVGPFSLPLEVLDLSYLRVYLQYEMGKGANGLDLERFIDDFIFICFFVGNDFLPRLPTMQIREGALDLLLDIYHKLQRKLPGDYLTENGKVRLYNV